MAQSIKLGNDLYIARSGVAGVKGLLGSGDNLNDYWMVHQSGIYYLSSGVTNSPVNYTFCYVCGSGESASAPCIQVVFAQNAIYTRSRYTQTWSSWYKYTGEIVS